MTYADYANNLTAREAWWETATREESASAFPGYDFIEAYWPLDGNYLDYIGANNGSPEGSPVFAAGAIGDALDLENSNNQSILIADNASLKIGDNKFCFAGWFYLESKGANRVFLGKVAQSPDIFEYKIEYESSADRIKGFLGNGSGTFVATVTASTYGSPSTGAWIFVCFWQDTDANTLNISINNGAVNSVSCTGGATGTAPFRIGAQDYTGARQYFDGKIQQLYYWKGYFPDATAITTLYNGGTPLALADIDSSYEANQFAKAIWEETTREETTLPAFYTGYGKRKPVLLKGDKVSGTVTDYPKLLTITTDTEIAAELSATKLAFTNYSGTLVPHGLYPTSNPAAGTILCRVKVTMVEDTDGFYFLHYDDAGTDQEDKAGTVSNSYALFMPLEEDPSGGAPQMLDWATETNVGTSAGSMTSGDLVAGQVGNGLDFDGSNDGLLLISGWTPPTNGTVEAIVDATGDGAIVSNQKVGVSYASIELSTTNFYCRAGDVETWGNASFSSIADSSPHYLAGAWTGSTQCEAYKDGASVATSTTSVGPGSFANDGRYTSAAARSNHGGVLSQAFLAGVIDELRISNVRRASNWIATAYTDDFDNANTFELGTEEVFVSGGAITGTNSMAFTNGTASLLGSGALTGTNAAAFTQSGTIQSPGDLTGTNAIAFTQSSTLLGAGILSTGSQTVTFTNSATLLGAGVLTGTNALAFTQAGTLLGAGILTGSSSFSFTQAAALLGSGVLAGTNALAFTQPATLLGAGVLAGTNAFAFTNSGTLTGTSAGEMLGANAIAFSQSATLLGAGSLTGTNDIAFTNAGTLLGAGTLTGTNALAFTDAGTLLGAGVLSTGNQTIAFTQSGTLLGAGTLTGTNAITFTQSGTIQSGSLLGTNAIVFTNSGSLLGNGTLTGTASMAFTNAAILVDSGALPITKHPSVGTFTSLQYVGAFASTHMTGTFSRGRT